MPPRSPDYRRTHPGVQKISGMSAEQIWELHPQFQLYNLEKFETYNKNMKALTSKRKGMISEEEANFKQDMLKLPP